MRRLTRTIVVSCFMAVSAAGGRAAGAESAQNGRKTAGKPEEKKYVRYVPATQKQIEANRKLAKAWAGQTQKAIAPTMHLVETKHFLIFSAWDRGNDRPLARICEKVYEALRVQFDLPAGANIWAGKCPVYIFWEEKHFKRFTTEVDKVGADEADMTGAAGYNSQRGHFTHIVMNRTRSKTWFYEVLIHEATHAFLGRYLSNRPVPDWVNEGLADYMAAKLVQGAWARKKYLQATREALTKRKDISDVFETVRPKAYDYGIAQSLVRYLIARDRKGFVKFVTLMKQGKSEADALAESFALTQAELIRDWKRAAAREYHRL